ncbi:MAG: proline dehydrogenase family protein [Oligoflexia bacterium]|nr:proline dehydrogenase family protein [Oligoflexia bacterium]
MNNGNGNLTDIWLPKLQRQNIILFDESWSFFFWTEFKSKLMVDDKNFKSDVLDNISLQIKIFKKFNSHTSATVDNNTNNDGNVFRNITIDNIPFTLVILLKSNHLYLFSFNLSNEMFLNAEIEKIINITNPEMATLLTTLKESYQPVARIISIVNSINVNKLPSEIEFSTYKYGLPYLDNSSTTNIENNLYEGIGQKNFLNIDRNFIEYLNNLITLIVSYKRTIFEKISDYYLNTFAKYAIIRNNLLTFVTIIPNLNKNNDPSGKELKHLLQETIREIVYQSTENFKKGTTGEYAPISKWYKLLITILRPIIFIAPSFLVSFFTRKSIEIFSKRFIAAKSIEDATNIIKNLHHLGRDATFDILGELALTESCAQKYTEDVLKLLDHKVNISIKMTALASNFNGFSFDDLYQKVAPRLKSILLKAHQQNVFVTIDAEHFIYRDIIFEIYQKLLLDTPELNSGTHSGIVIQAYFKDAASLLAKSCKLASTLSVQTAIPIRLVKGAYWDYEVEQARNLNIEAPVFLNKFETDINFRQLVYAILEEGHKNQHIQLCLASHNFIDHVFAEVIRNELFPQAPQIEHQCLHKTSESLAQAMTKMKWLVRDYVTIGNTITGLGYFARRIVENSSQTGFLTLIRDQVIAAASSATPMLDGLNKLKQNTSGLNNILNVTDQVTQSQQQNHYTISNSYSTSSNYLMVSPTTFNYSEEFKSLFKYVTNINNSNNSNNSKNNESSNNLLNNSLNNWHELPSSIHYNIVIKAQNILLSTRIDLIKFLIHSGNKIISTAAKEVDLAINYCNYFLRQHRNLNLVTTEAKKVLIIVEEPFPFSAIFLHLIPALLTGNKVIIMVAGEQENYYPIEHIIDIFYQAGLNSDILSLLPYMNGPATANVINQWASNVTEFAGNNKISTISYQGNVHSILELQSKVNNHNNPTYATTSTSSSNNSNNISNNNSNTEKNLIKLLSRYNGKNGVIISPTADFAKALKEIFFWCYSNSGIRATSLSKIIIHNSQKREFTTKFIEMLSEINFESSKNPSAILSEFANQNQKEQIIKFGKMLKEETLRLKGQILYEKEKFIPLLIELPYWDALKNCLFIKKEVFGPFVHLVGYDSFHEAIELFNSIPTGTIGALYSESREEINLLLKNTKVRGTTYINPKFSYTEGISAIEWIENVELNGEKFLRDFIG